MGARFAVAGLALLTIAMLAVTVWLTNARSLPAGLGPIEFMPVEGEILPEIAVLSPAEQGLQAELERLATQLPGETGIAVRDNASGQVFHHRGEELYPQQSVTKLWVAMTALALVDAGALDLAEAVTLRREDLAVFHQPIRKLVWARGSFTTDYGDLLQRAITQSDNTANDRLLRRLGGPEAVQAFLDAKGFGDVRFGRDERTKQSAIAGLEWRQEYALTRKGFFDARDDVPDLARQRAFEAYLADPEDGASPVAMTVALARLEAEELLSPASTALLLDTLALVKSGPNRLKAGAPADWQVAHKTGTGQYYEGEQSGYNDVGLFTAPDGRSYAVAVLIRRTRAGGPDRMEMMQGVVRAVASYHGARYHGATAPEGQ